jgi:hypothetical protein
LLIAADTEEHAGNAISYAKTMVDNLPEKIKPRIGKWNETTITFPDLGNHIKALSGTPKSARSERAMYLLATEMAFWERDEDYWLAVQGALVDGGLAVIESTANGQENTFHQIWADPENGFAKHFYGWDANPEHSPAWYARKCKDIPDLFKRVSEYPETAEQAFVGSADSYFDPEIVARGQLDVRPPMEVASLGKSVGFVHIWKKPLPGRAYVMGVDCAGGQAAQSGNSPDWSDATVVDWATGEHVATIHTRLSEDEFADVLYQYGQEYNRAHLAVERNGPGGTVLMWLKTKEYPNLYAETVLVDEVRGVTRSAKKLGWLTTENSKSVMLSELYASIKTGNFRSPDSLFWDQAKSIDKVTKKARGRGKDDKVISAAIAEAVRKRYNPATQTFDNSGDDVVETRSWVGMW